VTSVSTTRKWTGKLDVHTSHRDPESFPISAACSAIGLAFDADDSNCKANDNWDSSLLISLHARSSLTVPQPHSAVQVCQRCQPVSGAATRVRMHTLRELHVPACNWCRAATQTFRDAHCSLAVQSSVRIRHPGPSGGSGDMIRSLAAGHSSGRLHGQPRHMSLPFGAHTSQPRQVSRLHPMLLCAQTAR